MFEKLLLSCAGPPSLIVLSGSTMSSRVCAPTAPMPASSMRTPAEPNVVSMSAVVENDKISEYRTTVDIAFAIER